MTHSDCCLPTSSVAPAGSLTRAGRRFGRSWLHWLIGGSLLLGGACSSEGDSRTTVRRVVGAEGADLEAGAASLSVPEGALSEETELEMRVGPSSAQGVAQLADPPEGAMPRSDLLTLLPHGLQFETGVQVELEHEPAEEGGALVVATLSDDQDQTWQATPAEFSGGVASFEIDSFSHYQVFEDTLGAFEDMMEGGGDGTGGAMGTGGGSSGGGPGTGGGMSAGGGVSTGGAQAGGTGGMMMGGEGGMLGVGGTGGSVGGTGGSGGTGGTGGTGGGAGGGTNFVDFGSYSTPTYSGTASGEAIDDAIITSFNGGFPFCIEGDIPGGSGSLVLTFSLTGINVEAGGVEFELSTGPYTGPIVVRYVDLDFQLYETSVSAGESTYKVPYADILHTEFEYPVFQGAPAQAVEFELPSGELDLNGEQLCVDSLGEYL